MSKDSTPVNLDPNDPSALQWLQDHTIDLDPDCVLTEEELEELEDEQALDVKEEPKRSRGGQPGNINAKKFGFYPRRLPGRELEGLDDTNVSSLKDEIDVMRIFSRKVAELGAGVNNLAEATGLLRVLSQATTSINRLVKTHTNIPDPTDDPAAMLRQALLELEDEWPELKRFGDQFRK